MSQAPAPLGTNGPMPSNGPLLSNDPTPVGPMPSLSLGLNGPVPLGT